MPLGAAPATVRVIFTRSSTGTKSGRSARIPEESYHLTEDRVDKALGWLNRVSATNLTKPWFMYFSAGAIHGSHQA